MALDPVRDAVIDTAIDTMISPRSGEGFIFAIDTLDIAKRVP